MSWSIYISSGRLSWVLWSGKWVLGFISLSWKSASLTWNLIHSESRNYVYLVNIEWIFTALSLDSEELHLRNF